MSARRLLTASAMGVALLVLPQGTAVGVGDGCPELTPTIVGTDGNDELVGTVGDDVIVALGGDDTVQGRGGDDVICGGDGTDLLLGGDGDDKLYGGPNGIQQQF